jgi:hypothetical protein
MMIKVFHRYLKRYPIYSGICFGVSCFIILIIINFFVSGFLFYSLINDIRDMKENQITISPLR